MDNAVLYWNKLNHNWKKLLLVNYDLNNRFRGEYYKIEDHIRSKGPYNAYLSIFNLRIRSRLDEFEVTEDSVNQLFDVHCSVCLYEGITDLSPLQHFTNLEFLSISPAFHTFDQFSSIESVKYLHIRHSTLNNLTGISKWRNLEQVKIIYCRKLENIEELSLCQKLEVLDVTYLGRLADISTFKNIPEIRIHKNMIHCDDPYFNKVYNKLWKLHGIKTRELAYIISEEEDMILKTCSNSIVKTNYTTLIKSLRFDIILVDYSYWILVRKDSPNTPPFVSKF